ncbi:MAG: twin-arginine translocase subunit TatB [Sphingomonadales bacterium]|nr:twin-arginine translocase subunit TatB [Sphingomonadales bacterium]
MFDIGWDEMLFTAVVAIVVIGPKDMPRALRTAGQWIGKMRRVSGHFRAGIETMIREAEMEEMEKEWREKNAAIMAAHPTGTAAAEGALTGPDPGLKSSETAHQGSEGTHEATQPPLKDLPPLPSEAAPPKAD